MRDKKDLEGGGGLGSRQEGNKPSKKSNAIYWIMGIGIAISILAALIF